jgi:hypothetical protein
LANLPSFSNLGIESEREVDGGRIDLFLSHQETNSALVVELKYARVGFLRSTESGLKLDWRMKYKLWKDENEKLQKMTLNEKLAVCLLLFLFSFVV